MAMNWPTFFTRLGSAVVFCAVMMAGLLCNEWSFLALVALIQVLCMREYFRLMKKIYPKYYWPMWMQVAMQVGCLGYLIYYSALFIEYEQIIFAVIMLPQFVLMAAALSVHKSRYAAGYAFLSFFYLSLPMILLMQLYMFDTLFPLMIILMIWCNDTLAYLVGSFIGKTPLTKISPKKTWEGTVGGVILTLVSVAVWAYFKQTDYTIMQWVGLALVVAITGTFGDLLESKLKRMADVKDSGAMMPGHGGALDRFDSLLIATPFAFAYISLVMY
ncbi:hypothetical protein CAP35_02745 [Chitinophagaceae bacterium IBVUCB1]|nr:hypothetical protein CAP35_02745 [Chitinophagaceae bacterium IBVUCB1]